MIHIKRAYEKPLPEDGVRVLVDRFWPKDLDEKHAKLDLWLQEVAPSVELHQAFRHHIDPTRWEEFQRLYWDELKDKHRSIKLLREKSRAGVLTLVHAGGDHDHNAAVVLKRFLEQAGGAAGEA
jgi:uncharacterized protein YeaO (DUF488 family)